MADNPETMLNRRKIFPRNLTAYAAATVRGNPANARPESGVDNTHPGLEFDQRNIDKAFLPGLVFEFQFLHGAKLVQVRPELFQAPIDLSQSDVDGDFYLYYIFGAFGARPDRPRLVELHRTDGRTDGYEVLRTVHDLEPGRIMVVIGRSDPSNFARLGPAGGMEFSGALDSLANYTGTSPGPLPNSKAFRDPATGKLLAAILVGERAAYLDNKGVIATTVVPPGDLTRSLCAPWQWDFADCGCHYWASNKPDIVIGPDLTNDTMQVLNFQRNRKGTPVPPVITYKEWTDNEMTQPDMIRNWETLPFVIAERETSSTARRPVSLERPPWSKEEIVDELSYLATIEHALCIEYLYAFYSINAPRDLPPTSAPQMQHDVFTAAQVVRSVAVDEMRHFRWANEALQLLGADICLDRATAFAVRKNRIGGKFDLQPLTPERLEFFIQVEEPSSYLDEPDRLDGLYTHLLASLASSNFDFAVRRRLSEIVKMIIDEGHEHWSRFTRVKALLAPYLKDPGSYLRVPGPPAAPPDSLPNSQHLKDLQLTADWNYRLILEGIQEAFSDKPAPRAQHISDARLVMYNLDDVGQELANFRLGMFFTFPAFGSDARDIARKKVGDALDRLRESDHRGIRALAVKQIAQTYAGPRA